MIVKKIHHPYQPEDIVAGDCVLILGFFDGVHLGHQQVIKAGIEQAKELNLPAVLMTFNRHPYVVYRTFSEEDYTYLTSAEQKRRLFEQLGIDILYEVAFTSDFGRQSPQEFVDRYIVGWQARVVVAGFDYTYGKREVASMKHLPKYARGRFDVIEVAEQEKHGHTLSSTYIRQLLAAGEVEEAAAALGRVHETTGFVVHGKKRGASLLGYPTANIYSTPQTLIPGEGVYVVKMKVGGQWQPGMASIGYNETFENSTQKTVEVHLLDFDQEIYGEDVVVEWHNHLRPMVKFETIQQLIDQLDADRVATENYFKKR